MWKNVWFCKNFQFSFNILLFYGRKILVGTIILTAVFLFSLSLNYSNLELPFYGISGLQTSSEYSDRLSLLNRVCETYKKQVQNISVRVFHLEDAIQISLKSDILVDRERDFFWCKVPKAASTSWVELFLSERKRKENNIGLTHTILRRLMPRPKSLLELQDIQTNSFSFLTVRHPFDRLLSAYRDKFFRLDNSSEENIKASKFYNLYGKEIIKNFRTEPPEHDIYQKVPTFKEFVSYLLETTFSKFNEHWLPYFLLCTPCHVRYNVIGKTETINEDSSYIMQKLKEHGVFLTDQEKGSLQHTHKTGNKSTTSKSQNYFSQIPRRMVKSLYTRYYFDFLMFGYDIEPFLSYAIPSKP